MPSFQTNCLVAICVACASAVTFASVSTGDDAQSEAEFWYASAVWQHGFRASGYDAMDVATFYDQYQKHTAMYDSVFAWLASVQDTAATMPVGKAVQVWSHALANVQDLELRPAERCQYEQHRWHIDLQWDVTGSERYGLVRDTAALIPKNDYNPHKDVQNFRLADGAEASEAVIDSDPEHFFLFFPSDIHEPCQVATQEGVVRKIVVKIEYFE